MARLVAPDGGVKGVDVTTERGTRTYNPDKRGTYNVNDPKVAARMKSEGFFEASLMGPTTNGEALGFTCNECGFGSWFKKCGRCGHENGNPSRDGE
jgi:hypothetical protein